MRRKPFYKSSDEISGRWYQTKKEVKTQVAGQNKCGNERNVCAGSRCTRQNLVEKRRIVDIRKVCDVCKGVCRKIGTQTDLATVGE